MNKKVLFVLVLCSLLVVPSVMAAPKQWANFPWDDLVVKYLPMFLANGTWRFEEICLGGDCQTSWPSGGGAVASDSRWDNATIDFGEGPQSYIYTNITYGENIWVLGHAYITDALRATGIVTDNVTTINDDLEFYNSSDGLMATIFENGNITAEGQICDVNGCIGAGGGGSSYNESYHTTWEYFNNITHDDVTNTTTWEIEI